MLKTIFRPLLPLLHKLTGRFAYVQDGLVTVHNHEFMQDAAFQAAYRRGLQASGKDYYWHWRVYVGLWAASVCAALDGDYVECGVNYGFMSSAIMYHLDWDRTGKMFYLLDTFKGLDSRFVSNEEKQIGALNTSQQRLKASFYVSGVDGVRRNFSEWQHVRIIEGAIPETLEQIESKQIAFAHIDMNNSPPEVAAAEFIWPRLVRGGMILLDDYAFYGYRLQKLGIDEFARRAGTSVLSLPTGQGLIIKAS